MKRLTTLFLMLFISGLIYGQGMVTGKVVDENGEALIGATVVVEGTSIGTITNGEGSFAFKNLKGTEKNLIITYVGYKAKTVAVDVTKNVELGNVLMEADALLLSAVEVVADYAVERKTPVAFSQLDMKKINQELGSRDIPLALNVTPSVYATESGGGAGDSRINVRGFNQRNVAVMINGVPINDMENGWVYWSNWDGLADAASSVQVQRGLSSVNLAVASIGGTLNIVSSPAEQTAGGELKFEYGSGNFMKGTVKVNSGLIKDKFAISAGLVRKVGDGIIDYTWTNAWAYYGGMHFKLNKNNRFELFGIGAPQRHGQNLYKQNIGAYSAEYAKSLDDYDEAALNVFKEASSGIYYNETGSVAPESYTGKVWFWGKEHDRYAPDFMNERENYFNKPLVNLNWYADFSKQASLFTTVYWSGGYGGGSGTYGSLKWNYDGPSRVVDYAATIANNEANGANGSKGILRNSINEQNTYGALSKLKYKFNSNLNATVGLDWRTAAIDHAYEVRDLLGGGFYLDTRDQFNPSKQAKLGDKINYFNTNTVDWLGGFLQLEYTMGKMNSYLTGGYSTIGYTFTDHFTKAENGTDELYLEAKGIGGYQVKGGVSYRFTDYVNTFFNLGYVSKVPIFDAVIDDYSKVILEDPENEKFQALELGANLYAPNGKGNLKISGYYTQWSDKTNTRLVQLESGGDALIYLTGMQQRHMGIELEGMYQPIKMLDLATAISIGDWVYTKDVSGTYKDYSGGSLETISYDYYVDGLKVGDAPQTQFYFEAALKPVTGLRASLGYRIYMNHYADFDAFSRTNESDRAQVWKLPTANILDAHITYDLPKFNKLGLQLFGHFFNVLNTKYIADAVDNSSYNAYRVGGAIVNPHKADAAEVYLGLPFRFNVGIKAKI